MPEAYTHIRIARAALQRSGQTATHREAFEMGANGPDPLFAYQALRRTRTYDLPALGSKMHRQQCGAFLRALVFRAWSPAQRCYVWGFLTHYAADAVMHPYVEALSSEGLVFDVPHGHGLCEVALDSCFYEVDYGEAAVPADVAAPALYTADLAEVVALLQAAILEVYGEDIPLEVLADAFHAFRGLHRLFYAPKQGKRRLIRAIERGVLHDPGLGTAHLTPGEQPEGGFPAQWIHPYTGEVQKADPRSLTDEAAKLAAGYIKAAYYYWGGLGSKELLAKKLGDHSYMTGLLSDTAPDSGHL